MLVSALLIVLTVSQDGGWLDQLAQARARWTASQPASYEYTLSVTAMVALPPVRCRVDPAGTSVEPLTGGPPSDRSRVWTESDRRGMLTYCGVEKLFGIIETHLREQRSQQVPPEGNPRRQLWHPPVTAYDPILGYPATIVLDPSMRAEDDELEFRVQDLVVIR